MRIIPLKEVGQMEPGEVVPAMRCQVKEVGEPKSGTNTYGDWTMQTLTVMDQTAVTKIKLFDCPVYDAQWVGLWIQVESTPDDKGKLRGIMVSSYKDKKEIQVKANAGAKIEQVTDETPEPARTTQQPARAAVQPIRAPEPAKTAPSPVQGANKGDPVGDARRKLGQQVNAMKLAYDAALYLSNEVLKAHPEITVPLFNPDILQKIAVTLAIELNKSGLVMSLPSGSMAKPVPRQEPPPPPEPAQLDPEDEVRMEF